ncbi:proline racemase [Colletotrichum truncatum]|uniref:Proline racemase n=1 Tax=Colletotrichum truncatum TaxID=5467 RepID=A0ACC3YBN6_COLTU|nr:proline racemase [Colletotrichum truncatum]KAF6781463.1 proline racemase [Colletotrichum truncatum]
MKSKRTLSIVTCHAEGESGDVIIGGVPDIAASTMHEKLLKFIGKNDGLRRLIHNEPRGRQEMSTMFLTAPCDPRADIGFLISAPGDWVPMSGSNTICTATVLLETGILPMTEPQTVLKLDTAAGLITVTADCKDGSCNAVSFDNVPAFVYALDLNINLPDIGTVAVDIAYGGQWYVVIAADALGVEVTPAFGARLIELGNLIKKTVLDTVMPTHPENPAIRGINNVVITEPLTTSPTGAISVKHTVIVTPGRLDRSPCGTGSSSRLAILHARKLIKEGDEVTFKSVINTEFMGKIKSTQKIGTYDAIIPNIKGRAWITGEKKIYVDPDDPFPEGFQI